MAEEDGLGYEHELGEQEARGRKRRALRAEEEEQDRARRRKARAPEADGGDGAVAASPVQRLQRRYGNDGLLRMRAAVQRQPWGEGQAPGWVKEALGITPESEQNARRAREMSEQAETMEVPAGGQPLAREVREPAERKLGVPLTDVNVVERADAATTPLEAQAFTAANRSGGHSVVLSSGVDLSSAEGQFTLAHELSHVAQQKKGEADSLEGLGGDESVRKKLEQRADDDATRLLGGSS